MHAPTLAALADRPMAVIAVACIAPVVYAEARGEPVAGMEAVAGVVLERARRSRIPAPWSYSRTSFRCWSAVLWTCEAWRLR